MLEARDDLIDDVFAFKLLPFKNSKGEDDLLKIKHMQP